MITAACEIRPQSQCRDDVRVARPRCLAVHCRSTCLRRGPAAPAPAPPHTRRRGQDTFARQMIIALDRRACQGQSPTGCTSSASHQQVPSRVHTSGPAPARCDEATGRSPDTMPPYSRICALRRSCERLPGGSRGRLLRARDAGGRCNGTTLPAGVQLQNDTTLPTARSRRACLPRNPSQPHRAVSLSREGTISARLGRPACRGRATRRNSLWQSTIAGTTKPTLVMMLFHHNYTPQCRNVKRLH